MNYYISDTHFGHRNCLKFDQRPFANQDEMDQEMIRLWNEKVGPEDDVYILGDFVFRSRWDETWYLKQLNGRKHLVLGNHDRKLVQNEKAMAYFHTVDKLMWITDCLDDEVVEIMLCHYPMAEWNKKQYGAWHIYGHIHGDTGMTARYMASIGHTLNAGAMINHYAPASLKELIENNEQFWKEL